MFVDPATSAPVLSGPMRIVLIVPGDTVHPGMIVPDPEYPGLSSRQEKDLKLAVESTCELCSGYFSSGFLEIHRISRRQYREMARDPSTRILVVCTDCHATIHRLRIRVKDQRAVVAGRSFTVRQDLRRALGYRLKPYVPPSPSGLDDIGDESFFHFRPDPMRPGR